ncbi:MAG: tRNA epoxyqueuosine(34) reductase QueG [Flavobacteriales bacterium]|jgi:epoxyqueuosine reductase
MNADRYKSFIKDQASKLGFFYCGFSKADFLEEEAPQLERWLKEKRHGEMSYMENHFDKRLDPRILVPGAKSVISLLFNYYPQTQQDPSRPQIAKYAYGEDYHFVVKDKLKLLFAEMTSTIGEIQGRIFVDSAPVMDKAWAKRGGLGWIGKNTNLIHPKEGSFFFIAELISDLNFSQDPPMHDYCGTCTRCLDACPTDALDAPYQIDASKCISYVTIELKDHIVPASFQGKMENWMFGCDICQDVCPWNRFAKSHKEERLEPHLTMLNMTQGDWQDLQDETFQNLFENSALRRTGILGIKRNLSLFKPIEKL